jgi:Pectate lyase superfamily protein
VSLNKVTLTGTYLDGSGNPLFGTVTFAPSVPLTDTADSEIVLQAPVTVAVNSAGQFSAALCATDDSDLAPAGWTWQITENIAGLTPSTWSFFLAYADGSTQDLSALAPVSEVTPASAYLPLTAGAAAALGGTLYLDGSPPAKLPSGTGGYVLTSDGSGNMTLQPASGGGGDVTSVNTQTGAVVLTAADVGAVASSLLPLPIADGGTGSGTQNFTDLTTNQSIAGTKTFTGEVVVPVPVNAADAATKAYVDATAQGLSVKTSVQEATTAALPSYTYSNGSSGVGATLTATANGVLTVDGKTVALNDRVLVQNETGGSAPYNGIYLCTTAGASGAAYVLTRTTDMDTGSQFPGAFTFVDSGTVNTGSGFVCTTPATVTIGTTSIAWTQFSTAGTYTAGTGLTQSGNTISLATPVTIANGGTGAGTQQAAINALAGATTSGSYLRGSGSNVVMSAIQADDVPTLNQSTTGTAANVTGTVATAHGGTGNTLGTGVTDWLNAVAGYGADPTGAANSTTAIQNALTAAATAGGGTVYLSAGTYKISNITIDTNVTLCGDGYSTILSAAPGTTGYMIALTTPATTRQVTVRNLALTSSGVTTGHIQLDNTGWEGGDPYDPLHRLQNIYSFFAGGDAFHFGTSQRELRVENCVQYNAAGYGFYVATGCTDSHFTDCTSGPSGNHGFYVAGWNNMLVSCKAFWSGYDSGTDTWSTTCSGFEVRGLYNTLAACMAQQCSQHGIEVSASGAAAVTGCECDSNSTAATNGAAINIASSGACTITGNIGTVTGAASAGPGPGQQLYGIQVSGTCTGTVISGNAVTGSVAQYSLSGTGYTVNGGGTAAAYAAPAVVTLAYGTTVSVNASLGNDFRLTLTGSAAAIANPTSPADGQVIKFQITQGTGGGFSLAGWGTAYDFGATGQPVLSTTAGKVDILGFVYNAALSAWCYVGSALGN